MYVHMPKRVPTPGTQHKITTSWLASENPSMPGRLVLMKRVGGNWPSCLEHVLSWYLSFRHWVPDGRRVMGWSGEALLTGPDKKGHRDWPSCLEHVLSWYWSFPSLSAWCKTCYGVEQGSSTYCPGINSATICTMRTNYLKLPAISRRPTCITTKQNVHWQGKQMERHN